MVLYGRCMKAWKYRSVLSVGMILYSVVQLLNVVVRPDSASEAAVDPT